MLYNPMPLIPLTNSYAFNVEHITNRRMRLIVYKNGEEYVCRKENVKQLTEFLSEDEAKAFKGRLQLFKHHNDIAVTVKGEFIGSLTPTQLQSCIEN